MSTQNKHYNKQVLKIAHSLCSEAFVLNFRQKLLLSHDIMKRSTRHERTFLMLMMKYAKTYAQTGAKHWMKRIRFLFNYYVSKFGKSEILTSTKTDLLKDYAPCHKITAKQVLNTVLA